MVGALMLATSGSLLAATGDDDDDDDDDVWKSFDNAPCPRSPGGRSENNVTVTHRWRRACI